MPSWCQTFSTTSRTLVDNKEREVYVYVTKDIPKQPKLPKLSKKTTPTPTTQRKEAYRLHRQAWHKKILALKDKEAEMKENMATQLMAERAESRRLKKEKKARESAEKIQWWEMAREEERRAKEKRRNDSRLLREAKEKVLSDARKEWLRALKEEANLWSYVCICFSVCCTFYYAVDAYMRSKFINYYYYYYYYYYSLIDISCCTLCIYILEYIYPGRKISNSISFH
tara:strand:- start:335 stop:1015 length:681 start_codon:yes stop_codon:yes gene_type:complete